MPLTPNSSFLGLAKETTRGTAVTPTLYLPVKTMTPHDIVNYLDDTSTRGSMVDIYGVVPGVVHSEYDFTGDVFPDTSGNILMGMCGSAGAPATGAVFTDAATTSGSAVFTSATAQFVASDAGKTITGAGIPAATTILSVQSSTGATLSANATATASGVTITIGRTSTYTHTIGPLNNAAGTGNQPPSYTLSDYSAINTRQYSAAQFSDFSLSFAADAFLSYTAKALANKSAIASNPTSSYSTLVPIVAWNGQAIIAGALNAKVVAGTAAIKRTVTPVYTVAGSQSPYRLWASNFMVDGTMTFIVDDETELLYYLNNTQPSVFLNFTQPSTGYSFGMRMTNCAFTDAIIERGGEYVRVQANYKAVPNTTDAVATGYSPAKFTLINSQATTY